MIREPGITELLSDFMTDYETRRVDDESYRMSDGNRPNADSMRDNEGFSVENIALCLKYAKDKC